MRTCHHAMEKGCLESTSIIMETPRNGLCGFAEQAESSKRCSPFPFLLGGEPQSSQQAVLVSRIKVCQSKEHIPLSRLFSSAFVAGLAPVEQVFHDAKDRLDLIQL